VIVHNPKPADPPPPQEVNAQVPGDAEDPRLELLAVPQQPDPREPPHQGILGHVLGVVHVPKNPHTHRENTPRILPDEPGVRIPVARPAGRNHLSLSSLVQGPTPRRLLH